MIPTLCVAIAMQHDGNPAGNQAKYGRNTTYAQLPFLDSSLGKCPEKAEIVSTR
jgi:hypothetical protein